MKYGKLFKGFITTYGYTPSSNRCSTLSYNELKTIAKFMYYDVVEVCKTDNIHNPLDMYMRQSRLDLMGNVYKALRILFN